MNYSINNATIDFYAVFSIRCGMFLEILQCKLKFLTIVVLPLAGPQIGQVDDILSKLLVWNVKKNCLSFYFNPDHCNSIHFDVKQLYLNLCVQRQYIIYIKCQNMHCTHTLCTVVSPTRSCGAMN